MMVYVIKDGTFMYKALSVLFNEYRLRVAKRYQKICSTVSNML